MLHKTLEHLMSNLIDDPEDANQLYLWRKPHQYNWTGNTWTTNNATVYLQCHPSPTSLPDDVVALYWACECVIYACAACYGTEWTKTDRIWRDIKSARLTHEYCPKHAKRAEITSRAPGKTGDKEPEDQPVPDMNSIDEFPSLGG
ncbi:hypothetical protein MMC26_004041 [Xylographa opegraphella]|nr:hypothetical protein [Xylographa opegraphella]